MQSAEHHQRKTDPIDELFHALAGIYGYLWTNMFKQISLWASAKNQWRKGLREINATKNEVNAALEKCRHLHNVDGTPKLINLQEFLGLIQTDRKLKRDNQKRLPKIILTSSEETANYYINQWRKILGRDRKNA